MIGRFCFSLRSNSEIRKEEVEEERSGIYDGEAMTWVSSCRGEEQWGCQTERTDNRIRERRGKEST